MMNFSKSIIHLAFIGTYKIEFLRYFSKLLNALGKRVIVIDATEEQFLQYSIPVEVEEEIISFQGIDYLIDKKNPKDFEQVDLNMYDVALIDYGFNQELKNLYNQAKFIFLFVNFERHFIIKLKEILSTITNDKTIQIFRDVAKGKINKRYIKNLLSQKQVMEPLGEYEFQFNEEDYQAKLCCQYDQSFTMKKISKEYKRLITDLIYELYDISIKDIHKVFKQVEGGKNIGSSVLEYKPRSDGNNF